MPDQPTENSPASEIEVIDRRKSPTEPESADNGRDTGGVHIPDELPVLPLIETVAFPHVIVPLSIGRESSIKLVDDAVVAGEKVLGLSLSKNPEQEEPSLDNVHEIGVAAVIHTMMRLPDGQRMIVQGLRRIRILDANQTAPYLRARIEKIPDVIDYDPSDST